MFVDRVFADVMIGFIFAGKNRDRIREMEYQLAAEQLGGLHGRIRGRRALHHLRDLGLVMLNHGDGVRAGADLIYLGHCGKFKANDKKGFSCTHAYAVTARGARALVDHTHSCQKGLAGEEAVDWAMIRLCQTQADFVCHGGDSVIAQDSELPSTIHAPTGRATT